MREIKFRAWNYHAILERYVMSSYEQIQNNCLRFVTDDKAFPNRIIMQYTGLKDKHEKDIYVGDILSDRWKVEVYQNEEGTYMIKFHVNPKGNKPMTLFNYLQRREIAGTSMCEEYRDCIIIGNIHDNPELLNETKT